MADERLDEYCKRELFWRAEGWRFPPGHDRDACFTVADGYAKLIDTAFKNEERSLTPFNRRQFYRSKKDLVVLPIADDQVAKTLMNFALSLDD